MTTPITSPAYVPVGRGRLHQPGAAVLLSALGALLCGAAVAATIDVWSPLSGSHQLLKLGWLMTLSGAAARTFDELLPVAPRRPRWR